MAMELDIIKTDTTWNDAAASLNNNFGKVKQAIAMGGGSGPIDTEMSDTSENAVQNKVIKKYIDDYDVYLEGYAEGVANDAEAAAKKYTDEKIAQIEIGGGGLKYVEERTVYPSKMIVDGEEADSYELSETEKAYNIETLDKAINERSVIIVAAGYIFQFVYSESDSTERIGKFSSVGDFGNGLLSVSITINQDGDAIFEQKVLELGEGGETDTSNLATKEELNNLTNEVIANEEVHAAALNDLNERKADKDEIPTKVSELDNDEGYLTETEVFGTVLYNVDVASTNYGTVTLSDSVANYEFVDFYAATNDKHVFFNRVYQPNGKKIAFSGVLVGNTSLFLKAKVYECNDNKLTTAKGTNDLVWAGEWGSEKNSLARGENTVGIWRVVGYKR